MNNVAPFPRSEDYYETVRDRITKLGYNDPKKDSDQRQRDIWNYIEENNISVEVVKNYDFVTNLAPREDSRYEVFQTRENCEDPTYVKWLYNEIYVREKQQKRIVMGWFLDSYFPSSGHKRSRCHMMGQVKGKLPQSLGHVLTLGSELSDDDKEWHGFAIAEISNHNDGESPEPESTSDIVSQVRVARMLHERRQPQLMKQSDEDKIEWGRSWIKEKKPIYAGEEMSTVVGDITHRAFKEDRKDPIPLPPRSDIANTWERFFPEEPFDCDNDDADVLMRTIEGAEKQSLTRLLMQRWHLRADFSAGRDAYWLVIRCGSLRKDLTSVKSVQKKRAEIVEFLAEWNKNKNYAGAGVPKVERFMFVKQLKGSSDEIEAHYWNSVKKIFMKKEKANNG
jgi:hypothetical protein